MTDPKDVEKIIERGRGYKARKIVVVIDELIRESVADSPFIARAARWFVERLGEQDWSTIETLAKLTRPASEKTREMVRAVYRARAEETTP